MKKLTPIKLTSLTLLTLILALFASGTTKFVQYQTQLRYESAKIQLNACHDEIAHRYALTQMARLP